jgi:hypothetical protein
MLKSSLATEQYICKTNTKENNTMVKLGIAFMVALIVVVVIAGMGIGRMASQTRDMANNQTSWTQFEK